ncbi:type I-E CRISPR-associated protein Cas5/CasD [Sessilibacter corallicola]|uniref:type I-E CRISPR-associated protein Cas5/CasD n=1 Tax=Sessilibacter corallicola TaxID=2904075 RepID=UPI001E5967D6|nr:type I-E CRISPR-associated protein Cas5/CasD [Sessilibacter corallicola]MCE2030074.1 type I-E CRISPR-associated protein Cas5/CasD [Sessilibacter corallicola]
MNYLVFRLYGPMTSWGEIAVGESRHTAVAPKKSAITGLLASALGIRRDQEAEQQQLRQSFLMASKIIRQGDLYNDYHTTQAPDSAGKFVYKTRRDELVTGKERLGTVLSTREYLSDAHCIIAITTNEDQPVQWSLTELKSALEKPKFHLFLGRKSHPLAAPLSPELISADNFYHALNAYCVKPVLNIANDKQMEDNTENKIPDYITDNRWLKNDDILQYYWEGNLQDFREQDEQFSHQRVQTVFRRDVPLSRKRWQFSERTEFYWASVLSNKEVN